MNSVVQQECKQCHKLFLKEKKELTYAYKSGNKRGIFCSLKCFYRYSEKRQMFICPICDKIFWQRLSLAKRPKKYGLSFCSISCSSVYHNQHKMYSKGRSRSKLEKFIEHKITTHYPELQYFINDMTTINRELDFYFPSLNLGIEINGIFHYKPIFGDKKLARIQMNDAEKLELCKEKNIQLYVYKDVSNKFLERNANKQWLDIKLIIEMAIANQ